MHAKAITKCPQLFFKFAGLDEMDEKEMHFLPFFVSLVCLGGAEESFKAKN